MALHTNAVLVSQCAVGGADDAQGTCAVERVRVDGQGAEVNHTWGGTIEHTRRQRVTRVAWYSCLMARRRGRARTKVPGATLRYGTGSHCRGRLKCAHTMKYVLTTARVSAGAEDMASPVGIRGADAAE
jgi:hypothetical protein